MVKAEGKRSAVIKHLRRVGIAKEEKGNFRPALLQAHKRYTHVLIKAICAQIIIAEVKVEKRAFFAHVASIFCIKLRYTIFGRVLLVGSVAVRYRRRKHSVVAIFQFIAVSHVRVTAVNPVVEAAKPVIFFVRLRYLIGVTCLTEVAAGCRRSLRDARVVQCGG